MSLRYQIAKVVGKSTSKALRLLNRNATSLPGLVALSIDPHFFEKVRQNFKVVMVTGTNGKTLTTSLIAHTLSSNYAVMTNESGSNMVQGIATTLLKAPKNVDIAVLEVDEANLKKLTPSLKPDIIVFTNVFRDQMDRFGEIYTIYQYMCDGAAHAPQAKLISNGDIPLFNSDELANTKSFFGFDHLQPHCVTPHYNNDGLLCPKCHHLLKYQQITYANLGDYYCLNCGFKRPFLDYKITKIIKQTRDQSVFEINNQPFSIEIGGTYNIYNALAAYSVGKHFEISDDSIQKAFSSMPRKFGRQEIIHYQGREIVINLVKNPVGFNQVIDLIKLDSQPKSLIALLNDNVADGQDVSWIWDADYESLQKLNFEKTFIGGIRREELALRCQVAGFKKLSIYDSLEEIITHFDDLPSQTIYVLTTYTALLALRELLSKAKLLSKEMK